MATKKRKSIDREKIAAGVRLMLEGMGEDVTRDGLLKTPERVADFYAELTEGMWIEACPYRRDICPTTPSSGTPDAGDRSDTFPASRTDRCNGGDRSGAYLHDAPRS
jgi:hypothetical protein